MVGRARHSVRAVAGSGQARRARSDAPYLVPMLFETAIASSKWDRLPLKTICQR
jgi:hypothetical protein